MKSFLALLLICPVFLFCSEKCPKIKTYILNGHQYICYNNKCMIHDPDCPQCVAWQGSFVSSTNNPSFPTDQTVNFFIYKMNSVPPTAE